MGVSTGPACARAWLELSGKPEGCVSENHQIMGSYLHGLFHDDGFRHAFLKQIKQDRVQSLSYEAQIDDVLDQLADHLEEYCDLDALLALA